jgi:hypothetical protein
MSIAYMFCRSSRYFLSSAKISLTNCCILERLAKKVVSKDYDDTGLIVSSAVSSILASGLGDSIGSLSGTLSAGVSPSIRLKI